MTKVFTKFSSLLNLLRPPVHVRVSCSLFHFIIMYEGLEVDTDRGDTDNIKGNLCSQYNIEYGLITMTGFGLFFLKHCSDPKS